MSRFAARWCALFAAAALIQTGCSSDAESLTVGGTIVDARETLSAPQLHVASVVSLPRNAGRSAEATIVTLTRLGAVSRVASVPVIAGDRVEAGDPVAIFESSGLRAEVARQRALLRLARARVRLLDETAGDIGDQQVELSDARQQLRSAIAQLEAALGSLRATRAEAAAALGRLEATLARPPKPPPGGVPGRPPAIPNLPDPAQLRARIGQMDAGIARLSSGLGQARAQLRTLESAGAQLTDARASVRNLRQLADIAADTQQIAVQIAQSRSGEAIVRATASGQVLRVAQVGDTMAPGATVALVAPDAPVRVSTWVPSEVADTLRLGADAEVWIDSAPSRRHAGRITRLGQSLVYPPTSYATREVHLLRGISVEVQLSDPEVVLPAGTPATILFDSAREARTDERPLRP